MFKQLESFEKSTMSSNVSAPKGFCHVVEKKGYFLTTSSASLKRVAFEFVGQKGLFKENTDFS
jgi:hypothetical protein